VFFFVYFVCFVVIDLYSTILILVFSVSSVPLWFKCFAPENHDGRTHHPIAARSADWKQDIVISLRSDEDALPHEHEQMHRQLVEKIIGKENVGKVILEREPGAEPTSPIGEQTPPEQPKQGQKG